MAIGDFLYSDPMYGAADPIFERADNMDTTTIILVVALMAVIIGMGVYTHMENKKLGQ